MVKKEEQPDMVRPVRTDTQRMEDEVIIGGGYRKFVEKYYTDIDIELWKQQGLYLSYLRESGNQERSAMMTGIALGMAMEWYEMDILEFQKRQRGALRQVAALLEDSLYEKMISGQIKSPAAYKIALETLDPDRYKWGLNRDKQAEEMMAELRQLATDWKARQGVSAPEEAKPEVIPDPPEGMDLAELLKLREKVGE